MQKSLQKKHLCILEIGFRKIYWSYYSKIDYYLYKNYIYKKTSEYKDANLGKLPNHEFRTNFKNIFIVRRFWKGPRNLLRKTCKGWGPIINPRSSFVDPSVLRFNARFTRGKSHWVEFISETILPIAIHQVAIHLHLCLILQFQSSGEIKQQWMC